MNKLPLHVKGTLLFVDNSTLSEVVTCPRKGAYKFLARRQLAKSRAALFFGGAIHKALEVRDRMMSPMVTNEVRVAMMDALVEYFDGVDMDSDFRNLEYAIRTIDKYNEVYRFDPLPPVTLPSGELAVELPFALEVGSVSINKSLLICDPDENNGQPFEKYFDELTIVFTGKMDRLVRSKGELMVFDHKTSSLGGPNFFNEFYTALQFRGYKWAAEQLTGERVSGVVINGIICRPPLNDGRINYNLDRQSIYLSDEGIVEWQNTFMLSVREWVTQVSNQDDFPENPTQSFPIRTGACIHKYGQCEYFDVCQLPMSQRSMMLSSGLYEDHSWSPLEDSAKPKPARELPELSGLLDHLL